MQSLLWMFNIQNVITNHFYLNQILKNGNILYNPKTLVVFIWKLNSMYKCFKTHTLTDCEVISDSDNEDTEIYTNKRILSGRLKKTNILS